MIRRDKNKKIDLNRYYNPMLKEEFIKEYSKESKIGPDMWNALFVPSAQVEEMKGKDICNFTYSEIESMLRAYRSTSERKLSVTLSVLTSYTYYCISKNFSNDNINHFTHIRRRELSKYVDKALADYRYISEDNIINLCNSLESYRDKYIVMGLHSGIIGKNYEDLINMKTEDLLKENRIRIRSTGEVREVSPYLYDIMEKASREYELVAPNGKTWKLVGDGVLKTTSFKVYTQEQPSKSTVTKRMSKIRENLNLPMLGAKSISDSGFYSRVMKYINDNNMDKEDLYYVFKNPDIQNLANIYQMPKDIHNLIQGYKIFVTIACREERLNILTRKPANEKKTG